jgi:GNAT superfamily N-acetyltransferase
VGQLIYDIRKLDSSDSARILAFTDLWIGRGYFSEEELDLIIELSEGTSFVAEAQTSNKELLGVRLSIAPGRIMKLGLKDLSIDQWPVAPEKMAYFKSLFVVESAQGQGIGRSLSNCSIAALQKIGAKAIACHSWLESPQDSSRKYLSKLGFQELRQHSKYWYDVDYECTRCGNNKCICTAVEMVKVL